MPGRHLTDHHVRHYMNLRTKDKPSVAAAKAAISTASAYRIESDPRLPSQKRSVRTRRRPDPLAGIFEQEVIPLLQQAPQLRAVTIFDELLRRHPDLPASVRRTLERRVRHWRAVHGPEQEVIFAQRQPPGRMGLSDFTAANDLGVIRCRRAAATPAVPFPAALLRLRARRRGARWRVLQRPQQWPAAGAVDARRRPRRAPHRQSVGGVPQPRQGRPGRSHPALRS